MVLLLEEGDVAKLQHGGDDLEHGCRGDGDIVIHSSSTQENKSRCSSGNLHSFSSGVKPIIPMESMVWVKFSESLCPGTGMDPPLRKRYWSAVPKRSSAREKEKALRSKLRCGEFYHNIS